MIKVHIIYGPKSYFDQILKDNSVNIEDLTTLSRLIQDLNPHGSSETIEKPKKKISNLAIQSEEYASATEHVMINPNVILSKYEIDKIFLHNPPNAFKKGIQNIFKKEEIAESTHPYKHISEDLIRKIKKNFDEKIYGQDIAKMRILASIMQLLETDKPVVLLFYGPSGVGKTEVAKLLAETLEGDASSLFRRQFSMFQTNQYASYLFGGSHSEKSIARELLEREANVILLDEFDKVEAGFHNAFYELFDEGRYVDQNYTVTLTNSIIICTTNYISIEKIREKLGDPIYQRFAACIEFLPLSSTDKRNIVDKIISESFSKLTSEQQGQVNIEEIKDISYRQAEKAVGFRSIRRYIRELVATHKLQMILQISNKSLVESSGENTNI